MAVILAAAPAAAAIPTAEAALRREAVEASLRVCWLKPTALTTQKVIAVVSGKGGVGKSMVTSLMAVSMNRLGYKTAILGCRYHGPVHPEGVRRDRKGFG